MGERGKQPSVEGDVPDEEAGGAGGAAIPVVPSAAATTAAAEPFAGVVVALTARRAPAEPPRADAPASMSPH